MKNNPPGNFPRGPVVLTCTFTAGRTGLILGWVIKTLHAAWHGQNFKKNFFN